MSYSALLNYIKTIHEKRYFMPPFAGNEEEVRALATYIIRDLNGQPATEEPVQAVTSRGESFLRKTAVLAIRRIL